jgi:ABC-type Fe3+-hydroxamate transport system substrate-binding protein
MFVDPVVAPPTPPARIISLVPSITVLLHALGLNSTTVGITKFCTAPAHWHQHKTRIGGTKNVDLQKIVGLQPDLIIANKEENIKEQVLTLASDFPVLLTDVNNLNDALQMITTVGIQTHSLPKALSIVASIETNFSKAILPTEMPIPAAYLIWKDPYMSVGGDTFIHAMMETAGFRNVFSDQMRYPTVTIQNIKASQCKVLLLSSEPYPFKEKHLHFFRTQLPEVNAILVNGEMFSWYGSKLIEAAGYFETLMASISNH